MTNARLEELRTKFQENPRRYFAPYANELRKSGDAAQAIAVCRTHLASQPGHVSGHIVLGQALYEAGDSAEARDVFTTALELDPENLIALRTLGEISQVSGDFQTARQWYERLLDADPRNSDVVQLLKDMPVVSAAAAPPAPVLDESPLPLPDGATAAVEQEVVPAATFHTSFTGSGPAYQSDAPEADSVDQEPSAESASLAEDSGRESAGEPSTVEMPPAAAPVAAELEMLDPDDFAPDEPSAITAPERDEATDAPVASGPTQEISADLAVVGPDPATLESTTAAVPDDESSEFIAALPESEPPQETPRALFAERGFDGPADDDYSWMTTPSAALSDLESAPEDWFDDPIPDAGDVSEPATAAPSAPEPSTDSWFEDVQSGATIEATEVASDDLWLPPDLTQLQPATASDSMNSPSGETAAPTEPAMEPIVSAHEEEAEFASTSSHETDTIGPVAVVDSGDDAVLEHHPGGFEAPADEPTMATESPAVDEFEQPYPVQAWPYAAEPQAVNPAERADVPEPVSEWSPSIPDTTSTFDEHSAAPEAASEWSPTVMEPTPADAHTMSEWSPTPELDVGDAPVEDYQEAQASHDAESQAAAEDAYVAEGGAYAAMEASALPVEGDEHATEQHAASAEPPTFAVAEGGLPDEVHAGGAGAQPDSMAESAVSPVEHATAQAGIDLAANAPQPAPFVTETLADLYLQQGFREEALAIYRQLAARSPFDEALRARVEALEKDEGKVTASADLASAHPADSQSVRAFFSRLARRNAMTPGDSSPVATGNVPAQNPEVPFAAAASALANLFAASKPPAADEGAAATLSSAFTEPAGRPSRAAERELSLDHLFRDVPPGEAPSGVTLDEFYSSQDVSPGSATEPGEAEPPEPGGTDIRQFTAWLEGLRKK